MVNGRMSYQRLSNSFREAGIDLTYDAFCRRKNHEAATLSLTPETLQRDVKRTHQMMRNGNFLIVKPDSTLMLTIDVSSAFALGFTALVTPYEIAFLPRGSHLLPDILNWAVIVTFAASMVACVRRCASRVAAGR